MSKTTATYCLKIVKSALQSSDIERAKEFLKKAEQSLPNIRTEIEEFEELYNIAHHGVHTKKSNSSSTHNGSSKSTHNSTSQEPSSPSSSTSGSSSTSSQEILDIEDILRHKDDYYKVLSVSKTSTIVEIKKAYKKSALKFHPDRNKHPKSEEAFKIISAAFSCLSDESKRRLYDQYGTEDRQRISMQQEEQFFRRRGPNPMFMHGFDSFQSMDEDEFINNVFSAFFGVDPRMQQRFVRPQQRSPFQQPQQQPQRRQTQQQQQNSPILSLCFQMLPIIVLFIFFGASFLNMLFQAFTGNLMGSRSQQQQQQYYYPHQAYQQQQQQRFTQPKQNGPMFSFERTNEFSVERETPIGKIRYYVDVRMNDMLEKSDSTRKKLHETVYKDYKQLLKDACAYETKRMDELSSKQVLTPKEEEEYERLDKQRSCRKLVEVMAF